MGDITVEAPVKPTEDPEKVQKAVLKIFPNADLELGKGEITGKTEFQSLWRKIEERKIRKTALEELRRNRRGEETQLDLSKTAAASGRVSIDVGAALGSIELTIPWEEVEQVES